MKRFLRSVPAALSLLLALPACAAEKKPATATNDADPALWVVKDQDTTIYLFGTIHVLKPGLTWFDEAVRKAFDSSGQVMLEIVQPPPEEMQALVAKAGTNPAGPTLTEQLPPARRADYAAALKSIGLPATAFDRTKPWLAAVSLSLIPLTKLGYDPANGPEEIIAKTAAATGKPVAGLETAAQQIGFFGSLSEKAQLSFLTSTLDELPKLQPTMEKMVGDWAHGDPDALAREMNDSLKDSPEVAKTLLVDRNARWAQWIKARMAKPGTVFIAVGAGHLAGADSVQAQLAKLGVKSARIRY